MMDYSICGIEADKVKKNPSTVREYGWGIRFFVHLGHHLFFVESVKLFL
jgi:hypothetical protein